MSRSRLSCLFLILFLFLALPATAREGEPENGTAPRPNCGAHVVFERFQQVVLEDILKHVLDEKNPELWAEAFAGGAGSRYRIHLDPSALRITFVSPRGHYVIGVSDQVDRDRLGDLVDNELPRVLVRSNGADAAPTVVSTIGIHPDWLADGAVETAPNAARHLEHLRGLVRAAFAGDAYLHPQQKAPDAAPTDRFVESAIQQVTIQELSTLYRFSMIDDAGRPLRMGLMAPGGIGKTFLCARFMRAVFEAEKVVLVVDNNDILDQSRFAYAREFGLRVGQLLTIYDNLSRGVLDPNRPILLINRTMLNRRWDEVVAWMGNARTGFVFDEAHHLGRGQGAREFQQIFERFNSDPRMLANIARQDPQRPHYLGLLASATFWHGDTDLIVNPTYLGVRNLPAGTRPYGKIYGPLLHDDERILITRNFGRNQQRIVDMGTEPEALRRGEATPEIARRQLLRAMGLGYLARLSHSDLHEDVIRGPNGEELPAFEVVRRIDAREVKIERTSIAHQLLEKVYQQLVGMRTHTEGDVSRSVPPEQIATLAPSPNRVLVLVRRTQVANEVRDQLRAIAAAHGDGNTEVRAVHTSQGSDNREDTLAWFRSEGAYDNPADRAVNKVLVVDQLVNEGVDVPETNAVVLLRPFGEAEEGSIRRLIQIITRASRTADLKTHVEIIDFSGASRHLRDILAINTQNYGGGAAGGNSGQTQIEVDIRPGQVAESVTRISFINAQPTALNLFQSEVDQWLLSKAPFDDPRFEGASTASPLATQILNLVHAIPKTHVFDDYYRFNNEALRRYRDNRFRELVGNIGPRMLATHHRMQSLYKTYLAHGLDRPSRTEDQKLEEAKIEADLRNAWFELLSIVRHVDFYQDREVTMSFNTRSRSDGSGLQLARFFQNILSWDDFSVLQEGDTDRPEVARLEVLGRPRAGSGNSYELVLRGPHAYSFLAGELGTHEIHVKDKGHPYTRFVFLRVTPPLDSRDPLWRHINDDHAAAERVFNNDPKSNARRVYNHETIGRDSKLPSLRVPLARHTDVEGDIDVRRTEEATRAFGRMLRMNHYDYLRSTIQDIVIPTLIRGNVGD